MSLYCFNNTYVFQGVNSQFRYEVRGDNPALSVNAKTGWLTVANHTLLDRESMPTLTLQVCARQVMPLASGTMRNNKRVIGKNSLNKKRQTKLGDAPSIVATSPASTLPSLKITPVLNDITMNATATKSATRSTMPFVPSLPDKGTGTTDIGFTRTRKFRYQPKTRPVSPIPSTKELSDQLRMTGSTRVPAMETLPFGTRTAPRKSSRSSKDDNIIKIDNVVPLSRVTSHKKRAYIPTEPTTLPPHLQENLSNRLSRSRRDAFRKFNSRRRNQPKSLIPIKILENQDSVVSGDLSDLNENASCAAIQLTLLDANDNNPVFFPSNQYHFSVRQDAEPGMRIGKVCDIDIGECYTELH